MPTSKINSILSETLYKNALYLIATSIAATGFGFIFWVISSRLYSPADIGFASASLSAMTLLATLSMLGFNVSIIKFLPSSNNKASLINFFFIASGIVSIVLALFFLASVEIWSPKLVFLRNNFFTLIFILFVLAFTLGSLVDIIFTAERKAKYSLIRTSIFNILKIVLLIPFISMGVIGLISLIGIAAVTSTLASIFILHRIADYKFKFKIKMEEIKSMLAFSITNYFATNSRLAYGMIMPIIIINKLGPESTAHFYISWMFVNLLLVIPLAISFSLLAESSHQVSTLNRNIKKTLKFNFLLLVPIVVFVIIFGKYLLLLFGKEYLNGLLLLKILAVSTIFASIANIYVMIKNAEQKLWEITIISMIQATIALGGSYILIDYYGLMGSGLGWLLGNVMVCAFPLYHYLRNLKAGSEGINVNS